MSFRQCIIFIGFVLGSFTFQGCLKDSCTRSVNFTRIEPIFENMEAVRNTAIILEPPKPIQNPGRVVSYGSQLLINEKGKGIHLIDNSDPVNPFMSSFLAIPGNYNFAVNNGVLYANSYVDLLVFELNVMGPSTMPDQTASFPTTRLQQVFNAFWENDASNEVAFSYQSVPVTEVLDCSAYGEYASSDNGQLVEIAERQVFKGNDLAIVNSVDSTFTTGGLSHGLSDAAIAQFTILDGKLYALNQENLRVFDLTNPLQPEAIASHFIGLDILKLGNYENAMTTSNFYSSLVLDVSNGATPSVINSVPMASACDHIAFKGDLVFISKNTGNECYAERNELIVTGTPVYDLSNIVGNYPMNDPRGMAIRGDYLLLCDGANGLKIFDISEEGRVAENLVANAKNVYAYDVLTVDSTANQIIVIGADGVYQYEFQGQANGDPLFLSKISFE